MFGLVKEHQTVLLLAYISRLDSDIISLLASRACTGSSYSELVRWWIHLEKFLSFCFNYQSVVGDSSSANRVCWQATLLHLRAKESTRGFGYFFAMIGDMCTGPVLWSIINLVYFVARRRRIGRRAHTIACGSFAQKKNDSTHACGRIYEYVCLTVIV